MLDNHGPHEGDVRCVRIRLRPQFRTGSVWNILPGIIHLASAAERVLPMPELNELQPMHTSVSQSSAMEESLRSGDPKAASLDSLLHAVVAEWLQVAGAPSAVEPRQSSTATIAVLHNAVTADPRLPRSKIAELFGAHAGSTVVGPCPPMNSPISAVCWAADRAIRKALDWIPDADDVCRLRKTLQLASKIVGPEATVASLSWRQAQEYGPLRSIRWRDRRWLAAAVAAMESMEVRWKHSHLFVSPCCCPTFRCLHPPPAATGSPARLAHTRNRSTLARSHMRERDF